MKEFPFKSIQLYFNSSLKLELEMYVLSEQNLLRQGEKVDPDESIYHRVNIFP